MELEPQRTGLATLLQRNGESQAAIARKLGISPSMWGKILMGKRPLTDSIICRVMVAYPEHKQFCLQLIEAMYRELIPEGAHARN